MKVFYHQDQSSNAANSFSPSAGKPALAIADWKKHKLDIDVVSFKPATRDEFCQAHDPTFVYDMLDSTIANGFGNRSPEIAATLPYTTGSMLAAARYAVEHNEHVCSPTSGFHHAGYDFAGGFCTLNGLAVTLMNMRDMVRVGILDCDMHYGNGTDDILQRKGITDPRHHHTQGAVFHSKESVGKNADKYFDWLNESIHKMGGCDLILYQAGADPHINDPLGGLLTTDQLKQRDEMVFRAFRNRPLVWNLAGGYQRDASGGIAPVLEIHRNTVIACLKEQE